MGRPDGVQVSCAVQALRLTVRSLHRLVDVLPCGVRPPTQEKLSPAEGPHRRCCCCYAQDDDLFAARAALARLAHVLSQTDVAADDKRVLDAVNRLLEVIDHA